MRSDCREVMREISVNRTWERGHESVDYFQHPEVDFNFHAKVEKCDLPIGRKLFHVGAQRSQKYALAFHEEIAGQLFRDVASVRNEETFQLLVHSFEDGTVIRVPGREPKRKDTTFHIGRKMKLQAKEEAFAVL